MAINIVRNSIRRTRKSKLSRYKYLAPLLLLVGMGAVFAWGWPWLHNTQEKEKLKMVEALAEIQYLMEQKKYDEAFAGKPGIYPGLDALNKKSIADKRLQSLIHFYSAIFYKEKNKYPEAITHLQRIDMHSDFMMGRIRCLEGDMHFEMTDYEKALKCYLAAAHYQPNEFFTPKYLMKALQVYEKQGLYGKAIACCEKIITQYPNCSQYDYVKKQLARFAVLQKKIIQPQLLSVVSSHRLSRHTKFFSIIYRT